MPHLVHVNSEGGDQLVIVEMFRKGQVLTPDGPVPCIQLKEATGQITVLIIPNENLRVFQEKVLELRRLDGR